MSTAQRRSRRRASSSSTCCARTRRFVLTTHEHPDGDALGSLAAMQHVLDRAGQGLRLVHGAPTSSRCPTSTASSSCRQARDRAARPTSRSARSCSSTAATSTATRPTRSSSPAHTSSTSTTTTTTRASAPSTTSCRRRRARPRSIWDLMHGPRRRARPSRSPRRSTSALVTDTGKFMYENTGARAHVMAADLIDAGVDVHAIYRRLYEGVPAGQARAAGARPRARRALRRRPAHAHASHARGLRGHRRRRELLRGRRRPPARGRGHGRRRRSCATCSPTTPRRARRKVSLRATDDRVDVSRDRARPGRRRPPPRGRLLDDAGVRRARRVPARRGSPSSFDA